MADMPRKLPGLILVAPHAQLVAEGKKTIFVKSEPFQKYVGQEVFVISGDNAWAVITFSAPKKITLKQFEAERNRHRISDEERKEWWGGKRTLYSYKIFLEESFIPPLKAEYESGPQVFIREVEVSEPRIAKEVVQVREPVAPIMERKITEDLPARSPSEEVRHPLAKTLGDYIEGAYDPESVLVESMEDGNSNIQERTEEKERPVRPVRQPIPGTYADRVQKMRAVMGKSEREILEQPEAITKVKKSVQELDLLSRFKRKLQGHE